MKRTPLAHRLSMNMTFFAIRALTEAVKVSSHTSSMSSLQATPQHLMSPQILLPLDALAG